MGFTRARGALASESITALRDGFADYFESGTPWQIWRDDALLQRGP